MASPNNQAVAPDRCPTRPSLADRVSRRLWRLDFQALCAEAVRRTGLEDFGSPPLAPALPTLVDSLEAEADLSPMGRWLMRLHLRELLETRLRLEHSWKSKAQMMEQERIERPVFIVGMPRSGSTFLHELLAANPEIRVPRVWEVMFPLAASGEEPGGMQAHIRKTEARLWWFRRLAPQADSVYPLRALTPHECVAIHSHTFLSKEFVSTCRIPAYEAFLKKTDLSPAYLWQKRFLQYLQLNAARKRWVLKAPDHVFGLDALFSVFPDASLIHTHRDPREVLKSSAELTRVLHRLYGRPVDPAEILALETRLLMENTERILLFRDRRPDLADRFTDVKYPDLIANPVKTVQRICAQFDIPLTVPQLDQVRHLAANRSRYRGHRAAVRKGKPGHPMSAHVHAFEPYCQRFGVPFQARPDV